MTSKNKPNVSKSSGNVYTDLGFKDPEQMKLKAGLAQQIYKIIKPRNLKQVQAAKLMGIDQPRVSKLIRGMVSGYSLERLFGFLTTLSADINVFVTSKKPSKTPERKSVRGKKGHVSLEAIVSLARKQDQTSRSSKRT